MERVYHTRVMAFLLVALGSMMRILPDYFGIFSQWKWIQDASWVVVAGGITLWIRSKYLQRKVGKCERAEIDGETNRG